MLEELKEQVCAANKQLPAYGLALFTWGNASAIDREKGLVVIKPSGVEYDALKPEDMVVLDLDGKVVEGTLNPSSDTPTHLELYRNFATIGGVVHTHSRWATIMAQVGLDVPALGTTHADTFYGDIPCSAPMKDYQIKGDYERETGYQIVNAIMERRMNPDYMPACLVFSHGPFTWGGDVFKAVQNSVILEEVCNMAWHTLQMPFSNRHIQQELLDKHFLRKHGENAYYGQK